MDNSMRERQAALLPQLVAGGSQNPGFVRGFWADDLDEPDLSVTFVVFETLDQAQRFREAVIANAPAQVEVGIERAGLRIVEIKVDAWVPFFIACWLPKQIGGGRSLSGTWGLQALRGHRSVDVAPRHRHWPSGARRGRARHFR